MPFLPLVAYTLKTYAKQVDFKGEPLSDSGWKAYCQSIKLRYRITHPKFYEEVEITDAELRIPKICQIAFGLLKNEETRAHTVRLILS